MNLEPTNADNPDNPLSDGAAETLIVLTDISNALESLAKRPEPKEAPKIEPPVVHVSPQIHVPAAVASPGYDVTFRRDAEGKLAGFTMKLLA